MKFLIYHKPGQHQINSVMQAAFKGAEKAGFHPVWRDSSGFNPMQTENAGVVWLWSLQLRNREILTAYHRQGIPVIVSDLGYLKRGNSSASKNAYYQMGLNQLNWLPPQACSPERFRQLKIAFPAESRRSSVNDPILLCGQVPDDAQHGMDLNSLKNWASRTLAAIRCYTKRPVIWRPHPLSFFSLPGTDGYSNPEQEELSQCLRVCHALVTHNSNSGNEALLKGIPVFCSATADCTYTSVANTDLSRIETPAFLLDAVRQYFYRLAYAQWTREEMATGKCFDFLRNCGLQKLSQDG